MQSCFDPHTEDHVLEFTYLCVIFVSPVGILSNKVIQLFVEHSNYPVERLGIRYLFILAYIE